MSKKLEPIYNEILKFIKNVESPAFAVLDFDNTCIVNDITEATLAYMARNNLFRDKTLGASAENIFENYWKLLDEDKIAGAYEFISKILSGFAVYEIPALADKVFKFETEKIETAELFGRKIAKGIKPVEKVIEIINFLKNNGIQVWIITASIEFLALQTLKHFNLEADIIGVKNLVVNGQITAELEKPLPMFEGKVDCIKKFIDPEARPLFGIGDSIYDLPMLEYCEIKAVVNRQNSLAEKAKQNNWFLI